MYSILNLFKEQIADAIQLHFIYVKINDIVTSIKK